MPGRRVLGRVFHDLLEQQVHEQEQRLGLENQDHRFLVLVIVQMLVNAGVLDQKGIARFPVQAFPVVNVVALAFEDVEHRGIHVAVLLAVAVRGKDIEVRLDRLCDLHRLRIDKMFAVVLRPALPLPVGRVIDARLVEQLLYKLSIAPLQGPDEGTFFGPKLPGSRFPRMIVADIVGRFRGAFRPCRIQPEYGSIPEE